MKQEQEELAFDRKILEQLLAESRTEQQQQSLRKVTLALFSRGERLDWCHFLMDIHSLVA